MIYTVQCSEPAERELAIVWNEAPDKANVSAAANNIDALLRNSSLARGNDQAGLFDLDVPPLRVFFSVSPDDYKVVILSYCRIPSS